MNRVNKGSTWAACPASTAEAPEVKQSWLHCDVARKCTALVLPSCCLGRAGTDGTEQLERADNAAFVAGARFPSQPLFLLAHDAFIAPLPKGVFVLSTWQRLMADLCTLPVRGGNALQCMWGLKAQSVQGKFSSHNSGVGNRGRDRDRI